jgi:hypothetical protein
MYISIMIQKIKTKMHSLLKMLKRKLTNLIKQENKRNINDFIIFLLNLKLLRFIIYIIEFIKLFFHLT